jgi:hypothetical protein
MNRHIQIKVIDRDGWHKVYPLQKNIIYIGSDPRSDLVLAPERGAGVAALHAQLLVSAGTSGCQLINLGDTDIFLDLSGERALPPRSATGIANGMVFRVGEFTLTFYGDEEMLGEVTGSSASSSAHIGLDVSLPKMRLATNQSLDGVAMVSNLGDQSGVQFDLELEGLEADCYGIEPGPLLSSGGEREVSFHLHHRGDKPLAGDHRITIRATAPQVYPGEQASVSRMIQVLPAYRHTLRIVPPSSEAAGAEQQPPVADVAVSPPSVEAGSSPADRASEQDWWTASSQAIADETEAPVEQAPQIEVMAPPQEAVQERKAEETTEQMAEAGPALPVAAQAAVEVQEPSLSGGDESQEDVVPPSLQAVEMAVPRIEVEPTLPMEDQAAVTGLGDRRAKASASADTLAEVEHVPQAETSLPVEAEPAQMEEEREEEEQAPAAELSPPPSTEEWWSPEATVSPQNQAGEPQALKLKASPPPDVAEEPARSEASPPPAVEDWWSAEGDTSPEERGEEQQVLRLKASPSQVVEAEQAQIEIELTSSAEDWWSDGQQVGREEPEQAEEQETWSAKEERKDV